MTLEKSVFPMHDIILGSTVGFFAAGRLAGNEPIEIEASDIH